MTKNLRAKPVQVWLALAILLPAAIICARLATPEPATDLLLQTGDTAALPVVLRSAENNRYSVFIRTDNNNHYQLEWVSKNVLTIPTGSIYAMPKGVNDVKAGQLIGRIEARGVYRFALPAEASSIHQLYLYDFIHEQIAERVDF